jgi:uncharacterized protein YndB with AHSA1/START domain
MSGIYPVGSSTKISLREAIIVGGFAMAPQTFAVERSITIAAPPESIYPFLADLRRWQVWSPWEGIDPAMDRTYDGADGEVGSRYAWTGNRKAGAGSMTITDLQIPRSVSLDLDFLKPFRASNKVVFTLTPDSVGEGTIVRWLMTGENTGLAKLFTKIVPTEKLVGGDFEKGLENLKVAAEQR